jgi:hypothetical protein
LPLKAIRADDRDRDAASAFADEHALPAITHAQETRLQIVTAQAFYGKDVVQIPCFLGYTDELTRLAFLGRINMECESR